MKNKSFGLKIKTRKTVVLVVLFLIFCFQKEAQLFFSLAEKKKKQFLARYRTYRGKYKTVLVSHYTDKKRIFGKIKFSPSIESALLYKISPLPRKRVSREFF